MKTFQILLNESIEQTKRVGIEHLNKLKPTQFVQLINYINKKLGNKISQKDAKVSLKCDGFSLRFGLSAEGKFFLESSNSGPQFEIGAFSQYTKFKKGEADQISIAYDTLFDVLSSRKELLKILHQYNTPSGIKVICECLYNPIGEVSNDTIKFIAINYDKKKLGKIATFVIFKVIAGDGTVLPESIIDQIKQETDDNYLFTDPKIKVSDIDFTSEIKDVLDFVEKNPNWEETVKSRKKNDKFNKDLIKNTLQLYQDKMATKILSVINDRKFSEEMEGIVIELQNGTIFKVIDPIFTQRKFGNE